MKINQIDKIDNEKGDWIILTDYGSEGLSVSGQYKSPDEAIVNLSGSVGYPQVLLYLPDFSFTVTQEQTND